MFNGRVYILALSIVIVHYNVRCASDKLKKVRICHVEVIWQHMQQVMWECVPRMGKSGLCVCRVISHAQNSCSQCEQCVPVGLHRD